MTKEAIDLPVPMLTTKKFETASKVLQKDRSTRIRKAYNGKRLQKRFHVSKSQKTLLKIMILKK